MEYIVIAALGGAALVVLLLGMRQLYLDAGASLTGELFPTRAEPAVLLDKRQGEPAPVPNLFTGSGYYLLFGLESGESIWCSVSQWTYYRCWRGEEGILTHQGNRFYQFIAQKPLSQLLQKGRDSWQRVVASGDAAQHLPEDTVEEKRQNKG